MGELTLGLTYYFTFYNGERPHQSLSNQAPDKVYSTGEGGGAEIVDRFSGEGSRSGIGEAPGQRLQLRMRRNAQIKLTWILF